MLKKLLIILSVQLIALVCGEIQAELDSYRLPNQTYPESYLVSLGFGSFDQNDLNYTGTVTINVVILEATNTITLHSSVQSISRLSKIINGTRIDLNYTLDNEREFLTIYELNDDLFEVDTIVIIRIQFAGIINEFPTTQGVYRGIYMDEHLVEQ